MLKEKTIIEKVKKEKVKKEKVINDKAKKEKVVNDKIDHEMNTKQKIIIVDDNPPHLYICKEVLKDTYDVYPVTTVKKMFSVLKKFIPDLILLDVEMPGTNGHEAIKMLKSDDAYKEIPVIFLSAMDDAESEIEGLDLGAVDYIHKPVVPELLAKRIETHARVIKDKKELVTLNKSIEELFALKSNEINPQVEHEVLKYLLLKNELLSQVGDGLRVQLLTIIKMIETAIKTNDIDEIKHCLGKADIEARLILEIIDDALSVAD